MDHVCKKIIIILKSYEYKSRNIFTFSEILGITSSSDLVQTVYIFIQFYVVKKLRNQLSEVYVDHPLNNVVYFSHYIGSVLNSFKWCLVEISIIRFHRWEMLTIVVWHKFRDTMRMLYNTLCRYTRYYIFNWFILNRVCHY